MSDTTTSPEVTSVNLKEIDWKSLPVQVDATSQEEYKESNGLRLYKDRFEKLPGSEVWIPQFESLDALASHYNHKQILSLVNAALNSQTRIKAKNRIPEFKDTAAADAYKAEVKANGKTLYTESDALNFVPGERELSFAGMMNLAKKLKAEGKISEARALLVRAMELAEAEA